jgi:hypothetical protein
MNSIATIIKLVINKVTVPKERRGRGRKGYGNVRRARLLVYAKSKGIHTDKGLIRYLKKNKKDVKELGFERIPHRTTVGRWKRYCSMMKQVFCNIVFFILLLFQLKFVIVDSTPIEDQRDSDAEIGYYSKGKFKGFKLHTLVNQLGLFLNADFTKANVHDTKVFPALLELPISDAHGVPLLGDAGYDSKDNRKLARKKGFKPIIAKNPRNTGRKFRTPKMLKKKRYVTEQSNSLIKTVLKKSWQLVKGLTKKASMIFAGLIVANIVAMISLLTGKSSLLEISEYWY